MVFQEPKVEFVAIDKTNVIATSYCPDGPVQSTWEGCGCSDGVNETLVPCDDIV